MFQMRDRDHDRDEEDERRDSEPAGHDPQCESEDEQDAEYNFWEEMVRRHENEKGGEA